MKIDHAKSTKTAHRFKHLRENRELSRRIKAYYAVKKHLRNCFSKPPPTWGYFYPGFCEKPETTAFSNIRRKKKCTCDRQDLTLRNTIWRVIAFT